jgi:hypothetical protein
MLHRREEWELTDGSCTNTTATAVTGSWSIYKWSWQFSGSQALDEAYVPFFGAFGAAWDDAMVAHWSANPFGMLWLETDAAFVTSGGENRAPRAAARRPDGHHRCGLVCWISQLGRARNRDRCLMPASGGGACR